MPKRRKIFMFLVLIIVLILIVVGLKKRGSFRDLIVKRRLNNNPPSVTVPPVNDGGSGITPTPTPATTPAPAPQPPETSYNVGFTSKSITITGEDGKNHTLTTAFWYPTDTTPQKYVYDTIDGGLKRAKTTSVVSKDAPVKNGRFPLILFFHGAFMCGTQTLFLTERLASQGFIIAAPDFPDDANLCNTNGGAKSGVLEGARTLKNFLAQDREIATSKLSENLRVPGASKILDAIITMNKSSNSFIFERINTSLIGASGHSYGGRTTVGLIGAHSNPNYEDKRIKAAVLLSAGIFPFENNLKNISIPIFVMQGDDNVDDFDLSGKDVPRKKPYSDASGPKYFVKLIGGSHGSFYNGACSDFSTVQNCQKNDPIVGAINEYSSAFFRKYLNNDKSADEILNKTLPAVRTYEKKP